MKLALVIFSLAGGGAERVVTTLANAWAAAGIEITVITLARLETDRYPVDPAVRRVALGLASESANALEAVRNNALRLHALRRAIRECAADAVISFMYTTNMLCILACLGLRIPVIVSDRSNMTDFPPRSVWHWLYRPLYRRAAAVVVQTQRGADDVRRNTGREAVVIANPLRLCATDVERDAARIVEPGCGTVLAVGRLAPEKGFDLLIDAFARVAPVHPAWRLVILGEGAERSRLSAAIRERGLGDRVLLPGFDDKPEQAMRRADLFVLSSRFEGFPNGLLEAMAEGLPCISFDCRTGPRELIEHGANGWLVPEGDVPALTEALDALMRDGDLRRRLGARAREVRQSYSLAAILEKWSRLLELLDERRAGPQRVDS
jgi:GalNAc-alpha-(1->4)-GalNAc-alpha-(1->3)-diNAcBac-PP-undecaprenol alpha-1,4-N-acetyl-D-galactosaminyltransferase